MQIYCPIYNIIFQNSVSLSLILISIIIMIIVIYLGQRFKRINTNLFYKEELFNSICNKIDDVFIIYNLANKTCEYISPNFEKKIGFNAIELDKNIFTLLDYVCPDKKEEIYKKLTTSTIECNMEIEFEYHHPQLLQKRWIKVKIYPSYNHNHIIRYIISIVDMTKEKEAQLVMEEVLINVQKANEAKKDFLSHMSHELKTQINAIVGMTQIASNSLNDVKKIGYCLDKINFASKNLLELINNILDTAKIDNDKLILVKEPFHLQCLLVSFSSLMNSQAEVKKQKYNLIFDDIRDEFVIGDSLRLMQIIGNCLSNAFKFTPSGGEISLEVTEIGRQLNEVYYRFRISDNGKGMSKDFIEHIFNPFEQEDDAIAINYGGTGLGMSITKNLIELMDGTIFVDSEIGVGTCITIEIAFDLKVEFTKTLMPVETKTSNTKSVNKEKRVLVVDDNRINLEITSEFLKYINIKVDTACTGYEAIKLFEASDSGYYDVILMDIHMPMLNGYKTSKALRSSTHPDAKKVCIIVMTADNFAENQLSMDCGINYHIAKPINIKQFNLILHHIISEEESLH